MIVAMIDKDYINKSPEDTEFNRCGMKWTLDESDINHAHIVNAPRVRFRCKDDDGEVYFGGWLLNDEGCELQYEILKWAGRDAGCTTIEVKDSSTNKWRQDIG